MREHSILTCYHPVLNRKEKALELFSLHCNCSQAVFAAYRQTDMLDEKTALMLSTIFGGGCAGTGSELCGAVTGALLAVSMQCGIDELQSRESRSMTYEMGKSFMNEFKSSMGSCVCESILGLNIGIPENLQKARDLKLFETRCIEAVKTASDILEKMLEPPKVQANGSLCCHRLLPACREF